MTADPDVLRAAALRALQLIEPGHVVGLGTGRAATAFIHALGACVAAGLQIRGIPTSRESEALARQLGIPLTTLDEVETIDTDVDGADEVDPASNLIKGYGGALVREKIVAAASRRVIILVGPEKLVPVLGSRGRLPVEVVPFGVAFVRRRLANLGCPAEIRCLDGRACVSDNGNAILDCRVPPMPRPHEWEQKLKDIPGVVGTGLFIDLRPMVIIGSPAGVEVRNPPEGASS